MNIPPPELPNLPKIAPPPVLPIPAVRVATVNDMPPAVAGASPLPHQENTQELNTLTPAPSYPEFRSKSASAARPHKATPLSSDTGNNNSDIGDTVFHSPKSPQSEEEIILSNNPSVLTLLERENPALYQEIYGNGEAGLPKPGKSYAQLNEIYDSMPQVEENPSWFERLSSSMSGNEWAKLIGYSVMGIMFLIGIAMIPLMMAPATNQSTSGGETVIIDPNTGLPVEDSPVSPQPQPLRPGVTVPPSEETPSQ